MATDLAARDLSREGLEGDQATSVAVSRPAQDSAKAGAKERNGGIDALRAAVTLLVVFHHTAITYGAIGGWYYKEIAPSISLSGVLLILFCTINQAWFMGLFFLLSGYFTPPALDRHGAARFVRERMIRLGIPLLVYFLLLHPLTEALAHLERVRKEQEEQIGTHPKGRQFFQAGMADFDAQKWAAAERNFKMALTFEPANPRYKEKHAEAQERNYQESKKAGEPLKIR